MCKAIAPALFLDHIGSGNFLPAFPGQIENGQFRGFQFGAGRSLGAGKRFPAATGLSCVGRLWVGRLERRFARQSRKGTKKSR